MIENVCTIFAFVEAWKPGTGAFPLECVLWRHHHNSNCHSDDIDHDDDDDDDGDDF